MDVYYKKGKESSQLFDDEEILFEKVKGDNTLIVDKDFTELHILG